MKLVFYCDNGANDQSRREEEIKLSDLGFTEEEWRALSTLDKEHYVKEWRDSFLKWGWKEI